VTQISSSKLLSSALTALGAVAEVLVPGDDGYAGTAATLFADGTPDLVVRPLDAAGVAAALRYAGDAGLAVTVRSGGHSMAGLSTSADGMIIDTRRISGVRLLDPVSGRVRVGAGATWGAVAAALSPLGLGLTAGDTNQVGVGGLTLGGGIGWMVRRYGLAIDSLAAAQVVTADGRLIGADAVEHADLFWALRGGGGNFGVVTEFTFRAHPVSDIVGGPTFWAIEQTGEVLDAYRDFLPTLPRNASGFFCFHTVPPGPPFPEEIHMRKVCGIVWCIVGSDEDAEKLMAPMLEVAEPLMHGVQRMPLPALNSAFDGLYGPGDQWYWRADFVNEIPDEAMALNAEWNERMPSWKSGSHIYPIDGAAHDIGADDTPWAYRDTRWAQVIIGVDPDPASAPALRDWTVGYWEALHPFSAGGAYVNFMMDEGQARVKATYGDNYDRLAAAKAVFDPENILRVNQNIEPAAA